ncbi:MAG: hypothetical protein WC473_05850 [Patescibacteria group bacterium]
MKTRIVIFVLSALYCGYLVVLFAASHYSSSALNPLNAEYYFKAGLYEKAIETEPSNAVYHMGYALDLAKKNSAPDYFTVQLVLSQLKQAVELRPFSKAYQEVYASYAPLLTQSLAQQTY